MCIYLQILYICRVNVNKSLSVYEIHLHDLPHIFFFFWGIIANILPGKWWQPRNGRHHRIHHSEEDWRGSKTKTEPRPHAEGWWGVCNFSILAYGRGWGLRSGQDKVRCDETSYVRECWTVPAGGERLEASHCGLGFHAGRYPQWQCEVTMIILRFY